MMGPVCVCVCVCACVCDDSQALAVFIHAKSVSLLFLSGKAGVMPVSVCGCVSVHLCEFRVCFVPCVMPWRRESIVQRAFTRERRDTMPTH